MKPLFHSLLHRRQFLRRLSLGAAGLYVPGAFAEALHDFPEAQVRVQQRGALRLVCGWSRGGAFRLFDGETLLRADTGPSLRLTDGRVAIANLDGARVVERSADRLVVEAPLAYAKSALLTPAKSIVLRAIIGVGCAGIFVTTESWLNSKAPPNQRGRVFSIYMVGSFLALIPPPLGLGSVELADGRWVKGFICEPAGLQGADDISHFGGWRAYMAQRQAAAAARAA